MATIVSYPNPTGSANCVLLASQENYYAPYLSNIGSWNQLRVSAYLAFCGSSGVFYPSTTESINLTAPNLGFYWGIGNFLTSLGSYLTPQSVGCNFIGTSTFPNGNVSLLQVSNEGNGMSITRTAGVGSTLYAMVSNGGTMAAGNNLLSPPVQFQQSAATGSTGFCVANTLVFTIFNKGQTGQIISVISAFDITGGNNFVEYSSFTDTALLRVTSMNLLSSGGFNQASQNLYYTTGCIATGGPLPIPDTVYFHSPFNNNLLRIHNLLVEKFY
jgi:hypothetical protein